MGDLAGAVPESELANFMSELAATEPDPALDHPQTASMAAPVAALGAAWARIRAWHVELPEVMVTVVDPPGWPVLAQYRHTPAPTLQVRWGLLGLGPSEVVVTLLHEAAHALAAAYGVVDTSRGGRWHNRRFLSLARDVGLRYPSDRPGATTGYGDVAAGPDTFERYQPAIEQLADDLREYRA